MKTFRLIGMALLAVCVSINFTSCSDDDEEPVKNDDGVITNQKRLMEIKETNTEGSIGIHTFSYDSKGRLISVTESWDGKDYYTTRFTWGNNTIIATSDENVNTYTLTDNLVRKQQGDGEYSKVFTYNSSNQLIKVDEIDDCSYTYTWDNGKMIKYIYKENNSEKFLCL